MKDRLTRPGGRVLLVLLIGSLLTAFAGAGLVMAQDANPVRALPAQVERGDEFQVTVTFTSPADAFSAIGLTDVAPAGWSVSVDNTLCTPDADASTPVVPWTSASAQYIWFGPYAAGTTLTAVYWVRVPADAALGTHTFPGGEVEYYIAETGPFVNAITGPNQVEVVEQVEENEVTFVVEDDDGDPLEGALVTVNGWEGLTDSDGRFTVQLPIGSYDYTVTKAGYTTFTGSVAVPDQDIMVPVRLSVMPVGGTAHPISRLPIVALWIAIGAAIVAGAGLLMRRRRATG